MFVLQFSHLQCPHAIVPRTTEELISLTFTPEFVEKCLARTKNLAAVGPDNIPHIALKVGGWILLPQLSQLFQLCLDQGTLPLENRDEQTEIFSTPSPVQYFKIKIQFNPTPRKKAKLRVRSPILVQT